MHNTHNIKKNEMSQENLNKKILYLKTKTSKLLPEEAHKILRIFNTDIHNNVDVMNFCLEIFY